MLAKVSVAAWYCSARAGTTIGCPIVSSGVGEAGQYGWGSVGVGQGKYRCEDVGVGRGVWIQAFAVLEKRIKSAVKSVDIDLLARCRDWQQKR